MTVFVPEQWKYEPWGSKMDKIVPEQTNMKSYLKFLSRNKLYTAIEAVGLAVSLAFVILIGSYVVQQYEVAHESPQWKRTFVLGSDDFLGLTYWDKEELEMNIPEVQAATRAALLWQPVVQIGEQPVQAAGIEADADIFKVFPEYHLLEGSLEDFVGKEDVFISTSLARKINAQVGQTIKVDKEDRTIKGIYADFDGTFFMPANIITNITNSWAVEQGKVFNSIGNYTTWFRVREDADIADVQAKVKALLHKNYDAPWGQEKVDVWRAYRMDEAFFFTGSSNGLTRTGNVQMLRLLTIVVLLLLLGVGLTAIPYIAYFSLMVKIPARSVAIFSYADPLVAVLLSVFALGERMTLFGLVGTVLIIGAAMISELRETPGREEEAS